MDKQSTEVAQTQTTPPKTKRSKKGVFLVLLFVLLLAATIGVYYWQQGKVKDLNTKVAFLQKQLTVKPANKSSSSTQTNDFTYKSFGMTLVLPKTYGLIVNVEGNKGGAPGATYRVATTKDANIFKDSDYQGVQLDIDNTFSSLDGAVSSEKSQLDEQQGSGSTVDRNYKVVDTRVAGLPAKLLTADGLDEYQGNVSVYLVGSGTFLYTITANGTQNSNFPILDAVLKGITLKPYSI